MNNKEFTALIRALNSCRDMGILTQDDEKGGELTRGEALEYFAEFYKGEQPQKHIKHRSDAKIIARRQLEAIASNLNGLTDAEAEAVTNAALWKFAEYTDRARLVLDLADQQPPEIGRPRASVTDEVLKPELAEACRAIMARYIESLPPTQKRGRNVIVALVGYALRRLKLVPDKDVLSNKILCATLNRIAPRGIECKPKQFNDKCIALYYCFRDNKHAGGRAEQIINELRAYNLKER